MKNKIIKKVICGFLIALTLVIGGVTTNSTTDPKDPPPQGSNITVETYNHLG